MKRPLVIFDLETTGLDIVKDRIIQIAYIKVMPDGTETRANILINPEKTIPPTVEELTGIKNSQVKQQPTFKQIAKDLQEESSRDATLQGTTPTDSTFPYWQRSF